MRPQPQVLNADCGGWAEFSGLLVDGLACRGAAGGLHGVITMADQYESKFLYIY